MNIGKLIIRNGEQYIRDLTTNNLHFVPDLNTSIGNYFAFEINENDDAVDLIPANEALTAYGIRPDTGSFYCTKPENEGDDQAHEAESYFGTCEITGMKGDIVPCLYLSTEGDVVEVQAGTWLVHSVLGRLAGAF